MRGLRLEYFSHARDKTRDVKYSRIRRCINSKTPHSSGERAASGADTREEIKDLSSVNGLLFDSIRSKVFVRPIGRVACGIIIYMLDEQKLKPDCILSNNNVLKMLEHEQHFTHFLRMNYYLFNSVYFHFYRINIALS